MSADLHLHAALPACPMAEDLFAALRSMDIDVLPWPAADDCAGALLIAPELGREPAANDWPAVAAALTAAFAAIQTFVARRSGRPAHVVALVPAMAAMGDPQDPTGSALAGAMLSLFRTLALELKKVGTTTNTLLVGRAGEQLHGAADIAGLIRSLIVQTHATITGQEIFACSGLDTGRLRP